LLKIAGISALTFGTNWFGGAFLEREICHMFEFGFGATTSRRVLGSLVELSFLAREAIKHESTLDLTALAE
jgi:hypothetical protein